MSRVPVFLGCGLGVGGGRHGNRYFWRKVMSVRFSRITQEHVPNSFWWGEWCRSR